MIKEKNNDKYCLEESKLGNQYYSETESDITYYIKCSDTFDNCLSCTSTACTNCINNFFYFSRCPASPQKIILLCKEGEAGQCEEILTEYDPYYVRNKYALKRRSSIRTIKSSIYIENLNIFKKQGMDVFYYLNTISEYEVIIFISTAKIIYLINICCSIFITIIPIPIPNPHLL